MSSGLECTLCCKRIFPGQIMQGFRRRPPAWSDYFATGVTLMYAVGAVLGLVGAVKVYQKWSHGDHDTSKVAASWFGSCIFLVIVATVLQLIFGV